MIVDIGVSVWGIFSVTFTTLQLGVQSAVLVLLLMWKPKNVMKKVSGMSTPSHSTNGGTSTGVASKSGM
jgi:uncharacterized membrane protein YgaE (UPF0421/DUF939 family)